MNGQVPVRKACVFIFNAFRETLNCIFQQASRRDDGPSFNAQPNMYRFMQNINRNATPLRPAFRIFPLAETRGSTDNLLPGGFSIG